MTSNQTQTHFPMKRISLFASAILIASSLSFLSSCNNAPKSQEAEVADTVAIVPETATSQELMVDPAASAVTWIGAKPGGQHNGTFGISPDSKLMVENSTLTGGTIMINMTDVKVLDLQEAEDNAKLTGHLKSADFFAVDTHPTATFTITNVEAIDASTIEVVEGQYSTENPTHKITGNLKLMNTEKAISFYANVTMPSATEAKASAKFNIDRTEFNVSYKAQGMEKVKDQFINNTVNVGFDITAKAGM